MGEKRPTTWKYEHGEVHLSSLPIAAGLLALNGAVLDSGGGWWYLGDDKTANRELLDRPGIRVIRTEWVPSQSHLARVSQVLLEDWIDRSPEGQGRHYQRGETAPIPQVVFHIRGFYESYRDGTRVLKPWQMADAEEWLLRAHQPGRFLVQVDIQNDWLNKLRNHIRDRYGMTHRRDMPRPWVQ